MCGLTGLVGVLAASSALAQERLASFEQDTEFATSQLRTISATVSPNTTFTTHGTRSLIAEFAAAPQGWPSVSIVPPQPLDLSDSGGISFDVRNLSDSRFWLAIKLYDAQNRTIEGWVQLYRDRWTKSALVIGDRALPSQFGLDELPMVADGYRNLYAVGTSEFNRAAVTRIEFYVARPAVSYRFVLDNVTAAPPINFAAALTGLMDRFGQNAKADWTGKLSSEGDFPARNVAEQNDWAMHPAPEDFDEYGADAYGPQYDATGFFRIGETGGRMHFIAPNGRRFWSIGMNGVETVDVATVVTGRESMFQELPAEGEPGSEHYGSIVRNGQTLRTFNFHEWNLSRRYGANWRSVWKDNALNRLQSWGFNTIGNWSSLVFANNQRVPYTWRLSTSGNYRTFTVRNSAYVMPDVYAAEYADVLSTRFQAQVRPNDPWLIGYFVDNELPFITHHPTTGAWDLGWSVLNQDASVVRSKRVLVSWLREQYPTVTELNNAWGTNFASYENVRAPVALSNPNPSAIEDLRRFGLVFANQYYQVVTQALRRWDTNHLYLGNRFQFWTPELVRLAANYCDVISFNCFEDDLLRADWESIRKVRRPILIGEFGFGARDRGLFGDPLNETENQANRAAAYERFVRLALQDERVVGVHVFKFYDEPASGRVWGGSNANFGFCDVTDTPYAELTAAARTIHAQAYQLR